MQHFGANAARGSASSLLPTQQQAAKKLCNELENIVIKKCYGASFLGYLFSFQECAALSCHYQLLSQVSLLLHRAYLLRERLQFIGD